MRSVVQVILVVVQRVPRIAVRVLVVIRVAGRHGRRGSEGRAPFPAARLVVCIFPRGDRVVLAVLEQQALFESDG